jgi:APA family basic amino acid/polyamine antiporter
MASALVVGNVIGSGVFLLPASLAPYGRSSLVGWLLTVAGSLLLAVVFSALSRAFPVDGGPYAYARAAFGERVAFVVAWGYWVSIWVGNAALATAAVSYASALVPGLAERAATAATVGLVWALTLVNCVGVRAAGWVQAVTTVLKLLPLLAVALAGALHVRRESLASLAEGPLTLDGVTAAATLSLWALLGLESATVPADKVKDPERTVPRATLIGAGVTALVCTLACGVVLLLVPAPQLAASRAPFADAARLVWGDAAASVVALFAAVSAIGALNGWILLQGELPYALARDGVFPRALARESARGTPVVALASTSVLVTLLVLASAHRSLAQVFTFMILLSTSANLVAYLVCSLALLVLMRRGELQGSRRGTPWLAAAGVLGALYSLWAIAGAGKEATAWGAVLLVAGLPVYALTRAAKA